MGFFDVCGKVGVSALNAVRDASSEMNEAYERGCDMSDENLLRSYRNATRNKKIGYAKAIKERFSEYEIHEFRRQGKL